MSYTLNEAKELVVSAGKKLVEKGLIARTWGNVSARISDTQFVITPSGRAYETLTPDEIVVVNITDCSHEGDIKPSSEKGIHADAYKLRPEVNFIIHTHQVKASVVGATGLSIDCVPEKYASLIGNCVPVASYGMPSTDKLRGGVKEVYINYPNSKAFMMMHHGAVCLGKDCDEAFAIAQALEEICCEKIQKTYKLFEGTPDYSHKAMLDSYIKHTCGGKLPKFVPDFGESERFSATFELRFKNGKSFTVDMATCKSSAEDKLPAVALIHRAIYASSDITCIKHITDSDIVAYSMSGNAINPRLDDFAQIAGTKIKSFKWDGSTASAREAAKAAIGKNAVLIKGAGALCTGMSTSDINAVELVMEKECETNIGALFFGQGNILNPVDCNLMRAIYVMKYSKQAK